MAEASVARLLERLDERLRVMQDQLDSQKETLQTLEVRTNDHRPPSGPFWPDVVVEFVYLPLFLGLAMLGLWPLLGAALRAVESGCCGSRSALRSMLFRRNHLGLHERLPKQTAGQLLLAGIEGAASVFSLIVFVVESGRQEVVWVEVQFCLAVFHIVRRLVDGLREEFFLNSLLDVTVVIDAFTIPGLLVAGTRRSQGQWLSLSFLRAHSAVLSYERWKKLANVEKSLKTLASRSVSRTITFMALRMIALILAFAGITFVLEILGEVPYWRSKSVETAMGQITLFSTVYWVVETLTTVGYGDFTPTTVPSRVMCVLCMIAGILFFTIEMNRLQKVIGNQKFGTGNYAKQKFVHANVVLLGGCVSCMDQDLVGGFLDEIFSKNSHPWPDLVIMGPDSEKMIQLQDAIESHFQSRPTSNSPLDRIVFLVGSALRVEDLKRCGCDTAHMIYIMPDTSGEEASATEDKRNLLISLSVKDFCPQTSFRLMLLDGNSRVQALDAGIRSQRCFAVDEFRGAMLWESCRCPGWSTILSNLITNVAFDQLPTSERTWWGLYARGLDLEIYGFLVSRRFHGVSVTEFALRAFQQNGACVVAALLECGRVSLIPSREKIHRDMVVFAITASKGDLRGLTDQESGRDSMVVLRDKQDQTRFLDAHTSHATTKDWLGGELAEASQELQEEQQTRRRVAQELQARVQRIRATARAGSSRRVPFLLVVNLSTTWQRRGWRHFGTFLQKLRQAAPADELSIVMLCRTMPDDTAIETLGLAGDEGIGICVGEPTAALDLERGGARECTAIVCSSTSVLTEGSQREAQEMRDADSVLVYRVLEGMGQSHKHTVLEFRHPENLRLLPKKRGATKSAGGYDVFASRSRNFLDLRNCDSSQEVKYLRSFQEEPPDEGSRSTFPWRPDDGSTSTFLPWQDMTGGAGPDMTRRSSVRQETLLTNEKSKGEADSKPQFGDLEYAFNEHFASGGIFTPRILGTLMGGAYCNRALLEVVQAFLLLGVDGNDRHQSSLRQVSATEWGEHTYSDVFEKLTKDQSAPAVPLGLRRLWDEADELSAFAWDSGACFGNLASSSSGRYIVCNPEGHEVLRESDVVLVLASPEFVERTHRDGRLLRQCD